MTSAWGSERKPPELEEVLAKAIWRSRPEHRAGAHLLGGWRDLYHGIRAGNTKLRAEGERALAAQRIESEARSSAAAVLRGDPEEARRLLRRALDEIEWAG